MMKHEKPEAEITIFETMDVVETSGSSVVPSVSSAPAASVSISG